MASDLFDTPLPNSSRTPPPNPQSLHIRTIMRGTTPGSHSDAVHRKRWMITITPPRTLVLVLVKLTRLGSTSRWHVDCESCMQH
jgi:hypothetical protein